MAFASLGAAMRRHLVLCARVSVVNGAIASVAGVPATFFVPNAAASVAVGFGGQATYSISIVLPPGASGMAPNLSLSYTDGSLNGPLGVGWSVQGISTITRCGATKETDGAAKPVNFSSADKLCLDGQRLIPSYANGTPVLGATSDAAGAGGNVLSQEFRTEMDSFARVRAYGAVGNSGHRGPAYFKVWTKSGQVYEYGLDPAVAQQRASDVDAANAAQALILAQQSQVTLPPPPPTPAMVWAVRRVMDTSGNAIEFRYSQRSVAWGSGAGAAAVGKEWNIAEIRYTTTSSEPKNKVVFAYEDRRATAASGHDRAEAYQLDRKNISVQRLTGIRTCVNLASADQACPTPGQPSGSAVAVRAYKLAYDRSSNSGRSRLTTVTECVGTAETQSLPPTTFAYTAAPTVPVSAAISAFDEAGWGAVLDDYDVTRSI